MKKLIAIFLALLMLTLGTAAPSLLAYADGEQVTEAEIQTETETQTPVVISQRVEPLYPSGSSVTIAVKQTRTLRVAVLPEDTADKSVSWTSSNDSIVTVSSDGVIKGVSCGTALVTATANDGSEASFAYTVKVTSRKKGNHYSTKKMNIVSTTTARYTYNQLKKDLKALQAKYPFIMSYSSIGKTADNRDIFEVVIGNPNAKKHIIVQSAMHAREYINSLLTMRQIEAICSNYYTGTYDSRYYSELLDKVCLHVVPMVNPDGVSISQFGADGINDKTLKKNLKAVCKKYGGNSRNYYTRWKANGRGVDLNWNYPVRFKQANRLTHPSQKNYGGKAPMSENETQAMADLVTKVKPKMVLSYHSTGSIIYWNYLQKGKLQKQCKSLFTLARSQTKYSSAGAGRLNPCFGDWVCSVKKIPTITVETGTGECPIKIKEFKTIWKKNAQMIPSMLNWAVEN